MPGGLRLAVRLTPRGGQGRIDGLGADAAGRAHLAVRVAAPPEDGAANAALVRLLAAALDVPRGAVTIASGETRRLKMVEIAGEPAALARRLAALLGEGTPLR